MGRTSRLVLVDGFRKPRPDPVAFQEAVVNDGYNQVANILGPGYHVAHQTDREAHRKANTEDGQGVSIASRWSLGAVREVALDLTARTGDWLTAENEDWALELGHRIDYVMVRCFEHGPTLDASACARILDEPVDGVWTSDHFGVVADLTPHAGSLGSLLAERARWSFHHPPNR